MAYSYPFEWKSDPFLLELNIRSSIFTITGVCAGLPALVWSVSDLIHHRKNGHRISIFIILLLLTDFIELFLSPYILIKRLLNEIKDNMDLTWLFYTLWLAIKYCGFLLNQLVALEGILSVKYPLYTVSFFSCCFKILFLPVFLHLIIASVYGIFFIVIVPAFIVSMTTLIISCGASCSADRHSHTSRKPDRHIVVIFILTLLVFYLPFILLHLSCNLEILIIPDFVRIISSSLVSLRLISDPLLCVLVCRQNLSVQTSQTPEGLV